MRDLGRIEPGRGGLQRHIAPIPAAGPRSPTATTATIAEADHRIDPASRSSIAKPATTTPTDTAGIGHHVQEGAPDVEIALAAAHEQQRRPAVDEDADRGDDHHGPAGHRLGLGEAADRLPRDDAERDQQQQRVDEGREDRRAAQTISVAAAGRRRPSVAAAQAMTRPSTSLRLWPASASSAIEPLTTPYPPSTPTKARLSAVPIAKARPKLAGAWLWPPWLCPP